MPIRFNSVFKISIILSYFVLSIKHKCQDVGKTPDDKQRFTIHIIISRIEYR